MLKLYNFFIPFILFIVRRLGGFSPALAETLRAREGVMDRWRAAKFGTNRLWFHVSSVGELEQVRPIFEALAGQGYSLVLSYFSPSVPRLVKDWSFVQFADYLPLDDANDMDELVRLVAPRVLVLNRYDLWPNHLRAARDWRVPVMVVNASTPPLGFFGKISLALRHGLFRAVNGWTFVDSVAAAAWEPYILRDAKGFVAGNPRVDRALARVERALAERRASAKVERWQRQGFCLVAGSTWESDEDVILAAWKNLSFPRSLVIVPHEPEAEHLASLEKKLQAAGLSFARFSALEEKSSADVLIVDERGFLAELYGLGQLAYVGGGFKREVHSIIEPLAHGLPVAFGPLYRRSPEAVTLKATGSALALPAKNGGAALADWIRRLSEEGEERRRARESLRIFMQVHRGAGERIAEYLRAFLGDSNLAASGQAGIVTTERSET